MREMGAVVVFLFPGAGHVLPRCRRVPSPVPDGVFPGGGILVYILGTDYTDYAAYVL